MVRRSLRNALGHELHLPAHEVGERGRTAPVGDVHHEQARGRLEHLGHQVADAAIARRAKVDLAGPRLGIGHELLQVLGGHAGVDQQGQRLHGRARHGHKVLQGRVGQAAVQRGVDNHHPGVGQHDGVAVRGRSHDLLRTHGATGTGLVVHHHGLAQHGLQLVGQQARMLVQRPAGGEAHHDTNGLGRKRLRMHGGSQGQACGQGDAGTQQLHGVVSSFWLWV